MMYDEGCVSSANQRSSFGISVSGSMNTRLLFPLPLLLPFESIGDDVAPPTTADGSPSGLHPDLDSKPLTRSAVDRSGGMPKPGAVRNRRRTTCFCLRTFLNADFRNILTNTSSKIHLMHES